MNNALVNLDKRRREMQRLRGVEIAGTALRDLIVLLATQTQDNGDQEGADMLFGVVDAFDTARGVQAREVAS